MRSPNNHPAVRRLLFIIATEINSFPIKVTEILIFKHSKELKII